VGSTHTEAPGQLRLGGGRRAALLVVPIVALSIAGILAMALTPLLVRDHPLLLLLLESRNRYLLLVSEKIAWPTFVGVGTLRRFASDPFFYLLGRWYGDPARRWVARHLSGGARLTCLIERVFRRVRGIAVLLFPGALVCVLAGDTGMPTRRFVSLNLLGSLLAVVGLRLLARVAAGPLHVIVQFNDRNAGWLTVCFAGATVVWLAVSHLTRERPPPAQ
jgi:membrane protein DedA with SNARE-associated domain